MVGDFVIEKSGIKGGEQTVHLSEGNAQTGGVEVLGVLVFGDFGGEVEQETHFLDPSLVLEPFLVTAGAPAGKVIGADVVAASGEFFDNKAIGYAIAEQVIEGVPRVTGQACDFTSASPVQTAGSVVKWRNCFSGS